MDDRIFVVTPQDKKTRRRRRLWPRRPDPSSPDQPQQDGQPDTESRKKKKEKNKSTSPQSSAQGDKSISQGTNGNSGYQSAVAATDAQYHNMPGTWSDPEETRIQEPHAITPQGEHATPPQI